MCCDKVAIEYVNGMFVLNILFGFKFDVNSVLNFFLCVLVVMYFPLTTNYLYFWCFPTVEDFSITPCFFSWLFFFIHFFLYFLTVWGFFFHSMVLSMIITLFIVFSYCMRIFLSFHGSFHDYFSLFLYFLDFFSIIYIRYSPLWVFFFLSFSAFNSLGKFNCCCFLLLRSIFG